MLHKNKTLILIAGVMLLVALNGCKPKSASVLPTPQPAVVTPTATEAPMAARVNGEGILMSEYEAELQRYNAAVAAMGKPVDEQDARQAVLDYLTETTLLAQAAREAGYNADEAALQAKYAALVSARGGQDGMNTWMSDNFFTEESFLSALSREMAATFMRNKIADETPKIADQVHARQIYVKNENEAIAAQRQLQVGKDFTTLAFEYDPLTGGDLGWFPTGYLLQPDIEIAAFSLQPGQFSGIIQTSYGFHLVYVIERDPQHPLSPEALLEAQHAAVQVFVADRIKTGDIQIQVP